MNSSQRRRPHGWRTTHGQTLVEFALILPLFMVLLMGVIEFAFMFNATLSINFTSRDASLIAAEAGIQSTADCAVLAKVEQDVAAPLNDSNIQSVTIYKADRFGKAYTGSNAASNVYTRGAGNTTCAGFTPNLMPYGLGTNTYTMGEAPSSGKRCDIVAGCSSTIPIDSIGVTIVYRYYFVTPLKNLVSFLPGASVGYIDLSWSNVMRMEPTL